jgi:hypothetical protein
MNLAHSAIKTIFLAEEKVHGKTMEKIYVYELGSILALAQIIGIAAALEDLTLLTDTDIFSTPVAVGGGSVKISHGIVSVPVFATLEILREKSFPVVGGPVEEELTTPLGASILVNLAKYRQYLPLMKVNSIGYGAGKKDFREFPNVLRLILGEPTSFSLKLR